MPRQRQHGRTNETAQSKSPQALCCRLAESLLPSDCLQTQGNAPAVDRPMDVENGVLVTLQHHVVLAVAVNVPQKDALVFGARRQVLSRGIKLHRLHDALEWGG